MYTACDQMLQCQRSLVMERSIKWNSNAELAPNCPRCASSNTKFCYYNNYSFSQPRYFCKGCRRYWTKGGSLRDVPIGGGCRKSRRSKVARPNSAASRSLSPTGPLTSESPEMDSPSGPSGSDIDLAAVFAKYLNQQSPSIINIDCAEYSQEMGPTELYVPEDQMGPNVTQEVDDQVIGGLCEEVFVGGDQIQEEEQIQEIFMGQDPNSFGLQAIVNDELAQQEFLWSDYPTVLPNFASEPLVQLQEFGSFSSDDQTSEISGNIIGDNWSTFDLSAYEIFSRDHET